MDGFVSAQAAVGSDAGLAMGHYDERDVPFSWNIAEAYVTFDHFFSSARGGSVWNHMFWVAGAAGSETDAIPAEGFGDLPTIFDRLEGAGVSWKFYVQNYDPTITYRNHQGMIDRGSQVARAPLLAFGRFLDDPRLFGRIADLSEYYVDLEQGTLPAVSYIVPAGGGAHTAASIRAAEQLGGSVINALTRSTAWPTSMLLWTYSGWGGWYDHMVPPQVDSHGYGFRVPAVLVSPYARKGFVDHTQLDYASIVRFITDNWELPALAARDATAETFVGAFDFANPGRPPAFASSTREASTTRREPQRAIIFVVYGIALIGALTLIGVAVQRSRRPRDRAADAKGTP
jgi:phospholipase C